MASLPTDWGSFRRFFLSLPSPHCFYLTVNELPRPFFLDIIIGRPSNFAVHRHIDFRNPFAYPPKLCNWIWRAVICHFTISVLFCLWRSNIFFNNNEFGPYVEPNKRAGTGRESTTNSTLPVPAGQVWKWMASDLERPLIEATRFSASFWPALRLWNSMEPTKQWW